MIKAYKYRLYPNKLQRELIARHFGHARFVYNWGLERKIKAHKIENISLTCLDLSRELTQLKNEKEWLQEVNAQSLQMSLRNLDRAYTNFFRKQNRFPKFKNKYAKQSFQCPQNVHIKNNKLNLPKIRGIKIKLDREFSGQIKMVTISRTSTGKYFACINVEDKKEMPTKIFASADQSVGIDLGLVHFAVLSTGEKIDSPRHLNKSLKKLRRENRKLSRRKKGSSNRNKQRRKVALIHERTANQRADFLHKLSKRLIDENQAVCLEDLNVSEMLKNRWLARSISDAGWRTFRQFCEYKADWYGKNVKIIGRFQPSSKICTCGTIKKDLKLSDRVWVCEECDTKHDRDILAANNILKFAFLPQELREVTPVESGNSRSLKQEVA